MALMCAALFLFPAIAGAANEGPVPVIPAAEPRSDKWPWNVPIANDDWGIGAKAREKFEQSAPRYRWPAPRVADEAPQIKAPNLPPALAGQFRSVNPVGQKDLMEGLKDSLKGRNDTLPPIQPLENAASYGTANLQLVSPPSGQVPLQPVSPSTGQCQPQKVSWTRECVEAGYPPNFNGRIVGETRVVCPEGKLEDVWLENSCGPKGVAIPEDDGLITLDQVVPTVDVAGAERQVDKQETIIAPPVQPAQPVQQLSSAPVRQSDLGANVLRAPGAPMITTDQVSIPNNPVFSTSKEGKVDGTCGSAQQSGGTSAPTSGLCNSGMPSDVHGKGPWYWACSGINGGMPASCTSAVKMDAACGPANGTGIAIAPREGLCARGSPTAVSGQGPWVWQCLGMAGGASVSCVASYVPETMPGISQIAPPPERSDTMLDAAVALADIIPQDQPIDPSNETEDMILTSAPDRLPDVVPLDDLVPISYADQGSAEGESAPAVDGPACGPSASAPQIVKPSKDLCVNAEASQVTGDGPWSWSCREPGTDKKIDCTAQLPTLAECGGANGKAYVTLPAAASDLCRTGSAKDISGSGPWTWHCDGGEGGTTVACMAQMDRSATAPQSAKADDMKAPDAAPTDTVAKATIQPPLPPSLPLPKAPVVAAPSTSLAPAVTQAAPAPAVPASQPEAWTATKGLSTADLNARMLQQLEQGKTLAPVVGSAQAPSASTVASAAAVPPTVSAPAPTPVPDYSRTTKSGVPNLATETIAMPRRAVMNATTSVPETTRIQAPVQAGEGGQSAPAAVADQPAETTARPAAASASGLIVPAQGLCGKAAGVATAVAPEADLCTSGTPSSVNTSMNGEGPFVWSCAGTEGGRAVACTAPRALAVSPTSPPTSSASLVIDGACGLANGRPAEVAPTADLCFSGEATSVTGNGPWQWECMGVNGGSSSSCVGLPLQPGTLKPLGDATTNGIAPPAISGATGLQT
ncbi:MAG: hypothetical protein EBQ89_07470, partial [Alphaproteobacteria bacterium]|nr:hypothetical protein [Alphaproteobacteria bacterium]